MGAIEAYIASNPGEPEEISVRESASGDSIWLEQGDDMIELSVSQANRLASVCDAFVSAAVLKSQSPDRAEK